MCRFQLEFPPFVHVVYGARYASGASRRLAALANMFYGVTVGASAEGTTHLSSLLNATRGLALTKKLWLCLENFYHRKEPEIIKLLFQWPLPSLIHLNKLPLRINKMLNRLTLY